MHALDKAFADSGRSYLAAKAAVADVAGELLASTSSARGAGTLSFQTGSAAEQLRHFRGWPFACVHAVASRIAGQAVNIGAVSKAKPMRGTRAATPAGVEAIDSHPLLDLLSDPNDLQIAWSLWYFTAASLELTGRCLWYVPATEPVRIYPLPTSWLTGFEGTTRFEAFKVRPPGMAQEQTIDADEAVYFSYPSPADPHAAASPLQAAAAAVTADDAIAASQVAAFERGIFPHHAIIIGKKVGPDGNSLDARPRLNDAQRRQLINTIREYHRGASKSGEPLILDGLIEDVKRMSNAPSEMDWMESGKATKARIMQTFGVNPIILGEVEGANRASSFAAEEHLASTINPKLRLIGGTLTEWLAPRFASDGQKLVVWFDPYQPRDAEMELKRMDLLGRHGAATVNDLRTWGGLPPVDWGDAPAGRADQLATAIEAAVDGRMN
jgi:phage portal protein BeeE